MPRIRTKFILKRIEVSNRPKCIGVRCQSNDYWNQGMILYDGTPKNLLFSLWHLRIMRKQLKRDIEDYMMHGNGD